MGGGSTKNKATSRLAPPDDDDDGVHLVGPLVLSGLVGLGCIPAFEVLSVVIRLVSFLWFGIARIWDAVPVFERDFNHSETIISHKFRKTQR